mgnify:CR=1 FL=1
MTNAGDMDELFAAVITNKKFMFSSFYGFTNEDMMQFLEDAGLRLKTERGKRVFPLSDHSSDVIAALERTLKKENVKVYLRKEVKGLNFITEEDKTSAKAFSWKKMEKDSCGCGLRHRSNRRNVLSIYRIHRRWLSVGPGCRT